jgi:hypothetical protein
MLVKFYRLDRQKRGEEKHLTSIGVSPVKYKID